MPQPCRLTRTELHRLLQESGYGRDADMFACYFYRQPAAAPEGAATGAGGSPVLCLTCRCAVGEHDDDGGGGSGADGGAVVGKLVPEEATVMMRPVRAAISNGGGEAEGEGDDDDERADAPLLLLRGSTGPTSLSAAPATSSADSSGGGANPLAVEPATLYFPAAPQDRRARAPVIVRNTSATTTVSAVAVCSARERWSVAPQCFELGPGQAVVLSVTLYNPALPSGAPEENVRVVSVEQHRSVLKTTTVRIDTASPPPPASLSFEYLAPPPPPAAPPGLVADPQARYDVVAVDDSGAGCKVWAVAHAVSLAVGVPLVAVDDYRFGPGPMSITGMVLLSATWGISVLAAMFVLPVFSFLVALNQIYTVNIDPPLGDGATTNGNRTLWVDRAMARRFCCCCCCEPERPFKVKDLRAVRVEHDVATKHTRVTLHKSVAVARDLFGNVADAILVFRGTCADPEAAARAWREYLEPDAPELLDVGRVVVYDSAAPIADPPPPPPGVEARRAAAASTDDDDEGEDAGFDELAVDGFGATRMRLFVAFAAAAVVAGSVMVPVGVHQQQAAYDAYRTAYASADYRHRRHMYYDDDDDAGLGLMISGGILLGLGLLALPLLLCLHCSYRCTVRITRPRGGANAAGYGARTVSVEYPADRLWSLLGCGTRSRPPCNVTEVRGVRYEYHPITLKATVWLQIEDWMPNQVHVFDGTAATEADVEGIAEAWRAYLRPDAPARLRPPGGATAAV